MKEKICTLFLSVHVICNSLLLVLKWSYISSLTYDRILCGSLAECLKKLLLENRRVINNHMGNGQVVAFFMWDVFN